jgi:cbb3-type cytochrome oxidase subunit 3
MFQAVFRHSDVLTLPIVALVLFALAFVAVTVRALRKGAESSALAALPLEDDEVPLAPAHHGASHER